MKADVTKNVQLLKFLHKTGKFPCVRNCCLNDKDICIGCFRSLEEINLWDQANYQQQLRILQNAEKRREAAHGKLS
jgi:uncharacterized protein